MTAARWALIAVLTVSACHGGRATTSAPSPTLVAQPASAFTEITVNGVKLPASLEALVAPLVAAKAFTPPEQQPLHDYGLDHPVATIVFVGGAATTLSIGGATFDAHGFYVSRPNDADVYLVLSANVRPLLSFVGISTPAPT